MQDASVMPSQPSYLFPPRYGKKCASLAHQRKMLHSLVAEKLNSRELLEVGLYTRKTQPGMKLISQ